jgi:3-phytase
MNQSHSRTAQMLILTLFIAGCAPLASPAPVGTATIAALRETAAVASQDDAADDPAIWVNTRAPGQSLIIATDKKAGLGVYTLDGALRSALAAGRVNNVDLRSGVMIAGKPSVLVAASDRTIEGLGKLALFILDPKTATLSRLASINADVIEAYGACLYRARGGALFAFIVGKDGSVVQIALDLAGVVPAGKIVRRFNLASQSEGCVADDRTGDLYIGEERAGVWRFSASPDGGTMGRMIAPVDGVHLVADTEGVAIAAQGQRGGYLVVSSQGDSAYALYLLPELTYAGRFRIGDNGKGIGGTSDTDGIDVTTASLGRDLEGGMLIAQDGNNVPKTQNFKMIAWRDVLKALGL